MKFRTNDVSLMISYDTIIKMKPPYQITSVIQKKIASISEKLGEIKAANLQKAPAELRKRNRIKTIQSSLEIEGNTLTIDQVTAILENKRILAPEKDILEVQNAIKVYDSSEEFDFRNIDDLLEAHRRLMSGLIPNAGRFRTGAVGIVKGEQVTHVAPTAHLVYSLMSDLLDYVKDDEDLLLIKSCVFHYELELIHPFSDGNGRMGRFWQTLMLKQYNPVFEYLPIESLVKKRQQEYYRVLGPADSEGNSTGLIQFMLSILDESLEMVLKSQKVTLLGPDRISIFKNIAVNNPFSRNEYLRHFKNISTATASRDLKEATESNIIEKNGDGRTTVYRFIR